MSSPTSRPSDVVTGRFVSVWRRIRSTIASSRALGLIVLGPSVIASSAVTFGMALEGLTAADLAYQDGAG